MTTYPFTGDELKSISFTPSLDGVVYNASVTWNVSAQRWYITITSNANVRIMTRPLVGSISGHEINLLAGVMATSELYWLESDGLIVVIP